MATFNDILKSNNHIDDDADADAIDDNSDADANSIDNADTEGILLYFSIKLLITEKVTE